MVCRNIPLALVMMGAITFTNCARQASFTRSALRSSELTNPPTSRRVFQVVDFLQQVWSFLPCAVHRIPAARRYQTFHSSKESQSFFGDRLCPRTRSQTASVS